MTDAKPIVLYRDDLPHRIQIGLPAIVVVVDDPRIPPGHPHDAHPTAYTSPVGAVDVLSGEFWTRNTHYKPHRG
jgi:hypothetical protein